MTLFLADHGLVEALPVLIPALILAVGVAFMVIRERRSE
jgi:hypothetical protein